MKRLLLAIICSAIFLSGCGDNTTYKDEYGAKQVRFLDINDILVYDVNTSIVYIKNYTYGFNITYTPYYSENGKVCKYNERTCIIEELQ